MEGRMYFWKASERHLPMILICSVEKPCLAAQVAAPIRRLCDEMHGSGRRENRTMDASVLVMAWLGRADPSGRQNRGPGRLPRFCKYTDIAR